MHEFVLTISTRVGRVSHHFKKLLILKEKSIRVEPPDSKGVRRRLNGRYIMDGVFANEPDLVFDEFTQEAFSEDSVNISCVLTRKFASSRRLRLNFHGELLFDSDNSRMPPDRIQAAMKKVRELYGP